MARDEPEPPYCVLRGEQETEEDKNLLDTDLRMPIATSIDEDDQAIREERQRGRRQGRRDNIRGAILTIVAVEAETKSGSIRPSLDST